MGRSFECFRSLERIFSEENIFRGDKGKEEKSLLESLVKAPCLTELSLVAGIKTKGKGVVIKSQATSRSQGQNGALLHLCLEL